MRRSLRSLLLFRRSLRSLSNRSPRHFVTSLRSYQGDRIPPDPLVLEILAALQGRAPARPSSRSLVFLFFSSLAPKAADQDRYRSRGLSSSHAPPGPFRNQELRNVTPYLAPRLHPLAWRPSRSPGRSLRALAMELRSHSSSAALARQYRAPSYGYPPPGLEPATYVLHTAIRLEYHSATRPLFRSTPGALWSTLATAKRQHRSTEHPRSSTGAAESGGGEAEQNCAGGCSGPCNT